jgi:tetratricopeptide (TPR) repeat protein
VVDSVLREHSRWKSPWFVWVHFYDPHDPYLPPPPYDKRFTNPYDGELAFVDAELQRLMTRLKSDGSWRDDRDWAIVAGDHGEDLGDYGEIHHGILLTPATLRIPLIVFGPGIKAGRIESPVSITDVAPTIRSIAGIHAESGVPDSSGSSLLNQKRPGSVIFAETWMPYFSFRWSPQVGMLDYPFLTVTGGRPEKEGDLATRCTSLDSSWKMSEIAVSLLPEVIRTKLPQLDTFKDELTQKSWRLQTDYNQLEQLRSLGYLASLPAEKGPDPFSLPDPRWKVKVYAAFLSARELIRQGKWEQARIEFAQLLDRDPDNTLLLNNLATIQEHAEEFSKAESTLRKVISLIPTMDYPYVQFGSFLGRRNRLVEAREQYEKGLTINDRNAEAYLGLFQARMLGKEFKEAETIVNSAVAHGVQDPELSMFQAIFFRTAGQWTQAQAAISAADALNPGNPRILLEKEKILCQKESPLQEQCSPYLYTSFERMNSSAEWWILAAEWHASRGEMSESLYCWRNSQAASDTTPDFQRKAAAAIAGLQSSQVVPHLPVWVPGISSVPPSLPKEP